MSLILPQPENTWAYGMEIPEKHGTIKHYGGRARDLRIPPRYTQ